MLPDITHLDSVLHHAWGTAVLILAGATLTAYWHHRHNQLRRAASREIMLRDAQIQLAQPRRRRNPLRPVMTLAVLGGIAAAGWVGLTHLHAAPASASAAPKPAPVPVPTHTVTVHVPPQVTKIAPQVMHFPLTLWVLVCLAVFIVVFVLAKMSNRLFGRFA